MGKLAHEPGKTAATRANVRCLRRWLREILPVCANAGPAQLAVLRTEHEAASQLIQDRFANTSASYRLTASIQAGPTGTSLDWQ